MLTKCIWTERPKKGKFNKTWTGRILKRVFFYGEPVPPRSNPSPFWQKRFPYLVLKNQWYSNHTPSLKLASLLTAVNAIPLNMSQSKNQEVFLSFSHPQNAPISPFRSFHRPQWQISLSLRSKRFHLVSEQRKTGFGRARNEMRVKKWKRGEGKEGNFLPSPPPLRSFTCVIFREIFDSRSSFFASS